MNAWNVIDLIMWHLQIFLFHCSSANWSVGIFLGLFSSYISSAFLPSSSAFQRRGTLFCHSEQLSANFWERVQWKTGYFLLSLFTALLYSFVSFLYKVLYPLTRSIIVHPLISSFSTYQIWYYIKYGSSLTVVIAFYLRHTFDILSFEILSRCRCFLTASSI